MFCINILKVQKMNIYVSNLNFRVDDNRLRNLFAEFGEVSSAKVITDRATGRSRGFAFVEMPNDSEGENAINALNQTDFEGRTLNVSMAKPKPEDHR